jgi:hypothetical protein
MIEPSAEAKLGTVNRAIALFARNTTVRRGLTGWTVEWTDSRGKKHRRRWAVDAGQSFFPAWHHSWSHGGTACTALSQLMRWLQGRPVFGIGTWRYWTGEYIRLGSPEIIQVLTDGGYPAGQVCVRCGGAIGPDQGLDWWNLEGISGPCCRTCPL